MIETLHDECNTKDKKRYSTVSQYMWKWRINVGSNVLKKNIINIDDDDDDDNIK